MGAWRTWGVWATRLEPGRSTTYVRWRAGPRAADERRGRLAWILNELDRLARPFDEEADPVHVTASAVVVGPRGTVLHRHRLLGRWLQPGGHLEAGESPPEAARREVAEETGLAAEHPEGGPLLLRLDVHAAGAALDHTHLDLCYLLAGPDRDPEPGEGESPEGAVVGLGRGPVGGRRAPRGARALWEEARAVRVAARTPESSHERSTRDDPPEPPTGQPFAVLLAVQDLDTSIAQHEHRKATLPERRSSRPSTLGRPASGAGSPSSG